MRQLSVLGLLGASVLTWLWGMAMWGAWLAWDRPYGEPVHDPAPWQLVGCPFAIAVGAVLICRWSMRRVAAERRAIKAVAVPLLAVAADLGFVMPWSWDQARQVDSDGLFMVGSMMMFVGGVAALVLLLTAVASLTYSEV